MKLDKGKKNSRSQTDRRWTLLFIGDHGNVITLKRFKAIVIASGCLFSLALVCLAVLFFINQRAAQKNKDLQKRLENSQQQIDTLRHEKEILMARLVLAESKASENAVETSQPEEISTAAEATDDPHQEEAKTETVPEPQQKPSVAQTSPSEAAVPQTPDTEAVSKVAVENFSVSRAPDNEKLSAQFKIKNISPGNQRVAGRAVVVLKGADLAKDKWLLMPAVKLAGNRPSGKRGKSFSIQRFRMMQYSSRAPSYSDQFQTAAVYVFSRTGELLLEKDFAVNLPPLPVASADESTDETSFAETLPRQTPAPASPAGDAPAGKVPPSEASPADDLIDSIEDAPPAIY